MNYWTEAERAGLKAMGKAWTGSFQYPDANGSDVIYAIIRYIQASRVIKDAERSKEQKP